MMSFLEYASSLPLLRMISKLSLVMMPSVVSLSKMKVSFLGWPEDVVPAISYSAENVSAFPSSAKAAEHTIRIITNSTEQSFFMQISSLHFAL